VIHWGVLNLHREILNLLWEILNLYWGLSMIHWGVSNLHWGVLSSHWGVSGRAFLTHFRGFWVLRRKLPSLLSRFSGFLKSGKTSDFCSFQRISKINLKMMYLSVFERTNDYFTNIIFLTSENLFAVNL